MKRSISIVAMCALLSSGLGTGALQLCAQEEGPACVSTTAPHDPCTEQTDPGKYCEYPEDLEACIPEWACDEVEDQSTCPTHSNPNILNEYKYKVRIDPWSIGTCKDAESSFENCTHCGATGDCAYKCARVQIYREKDMQGECVAPCNKTFFIPQKGCKE